MRFRAAPPAVGVLPRFKSRFEEGYDPMADPIASEQISEMGRVEARFAGSRWDLFNGVKKTSSIKAS